MCIAINERKGFIDLGSAIGAFPPSLMKNKIDMCRILHDGMIDFSFVYSFGMHSESTRRTKGWNRITGNMDVFNVGVNFNFKDFKGAVVWQIIK